MNRFFQFVSICALAAAPLFAQAPQGSITVVVQEKATAREQLAYARTLIEQVAAARQHHDLHVAVANAAGNLNVIARAWPNDRVAIAEATYCSLSCTSTQR